VTAGAAGAGTGAGPGGWFDSHCHVQPPYGPEGVDAVDELLARARATGVDRFVCVGTDLASSRLAVALAATHADVYATVGLHPHDAARLPAEDAALHDLAASAARVVGVGEAGFDLYYRHAEPPEQEAAFRRQIRWAGELDRTLVIHTRDAWDDTFRVLAEEGVPARTVFHCFTGGPAEAARALELGAWLSFSGIVSFKNADDVRAAARLAPLERVLVETDSPYLAPVPHRGRTNEPAYVIAVGEALAAAVGRPVDEVRERTRANAHLAFGLDPAG
jgi:TatD DNase family protein